MQLIVNGENREFPHMTHLSDLAAHLELPSFGSAIELNGAVIRKADYGNTPLNTGDQLEIVKLVGGG